MLPICLGEATKVSNFLLDAAKTYSTRVRLGVQTSTGDPEGEALERAGIPELSRRDITEALTAFEGEIDQIPPMYSALKRDGRRLYQLAREGQQVTREPRPVTIHELSLLDFGADWLKLEVVCSKGTYIRVLAEDIGRALGTVAHAESLRRTAVGPFVASKIHTLDQLSDCVEGGWASLDALLISTDAALVNLPPIRISAEHTARVKHGNSVTVESGQGVGLVRIYGADQQFMGVGELTPESQLKTHRLISPDHNSEPNAGQ
nr:tRNA pseudouridine synthase B-like [Nerophis lumbriciformis]